MDTLCVVGTDIASFYLYEPDALQHRAQSPWGWFSDFTPKGMDLAPLTVPELTDGRLVIVDTAIPIYVDGRDDPMWVGSDGAYHIRCTTGGLTSDEASRAYPERHAMRDMGTIRVTQERLLLDGGYLLPSSEPPMGGWAFDLTTALDKHLAVWLELPNGTYLVTAYHLDVPDEDEQEGEDIDVPHIVLTFTLTP